MASWRLEEGHSQRKASFPGSAPKMSKNFVLFCFLLLEQIQSNNMLMWPFFLLYIFVLLNFALHFNFPFKRLLVSLSEDKNIPSARVSSGNKSQGVRSQPGMPKEALLSPHRSPNRNQFPRQSERSAYFDINLPGVHICRFQEEAVREN